MRANAVPAIQPAIVPAPLRQARSPLRAILLGWLFAIVPSLLLSALVSALAPAMARPDIPTSIPPAMLLFQFVVFAPVVETLVMAGVLALLLKIVPPSAAILLSAIGWGVAHSLVAPAWGLVIWWPFLIFSALYVVWRSRGPLAALAIPAAAHALQNLGPSLFLLTRQ